MTARPLAILVEHPRNRTAQHALVLALEAGVDLTILTRTPTKYQNLPSTVNRLVRTKQPRPGHLALIAVDTLSTHGPVDYFRHTARRPDAVVSFSHHFCVTAARLARELGCRGNDPSSVKAAVEKDVMRRVLAGNPYSISYAVARAPTQMDQALQSFGGRAIVKPAAETSSLAVAMVTNGTSARSAFEAIHGRRANRQGQPQDGRVLIEEVVSGPEFSVELMLTNGKVDIYGVTAKTPHPLHPFVEQADSFPYIERADVTDGLRRAASSAVSALGLTEGPAHVEVRYTSDGPKIIEINPRQPGGYLPTMIEAVTGRNVMIEALSRALGFELRPRGAMMVGAATWWQLYSDREGVVASVAGAAALNADPRVLAAEVRVRPGERVWGVRSNLDCIGSLVVTGDEIAQSHESAAKLAGRVQLTLRPAGPIL